MLEDVRLLYRKLKNSFQIDGKEMVLCFEDSLPA